MIRHYLKTVFRQALRGKLYTVINLLGLSVAIAACFVIVLFVSNEFSFDRFHHDHNKIYRVTTTENSEGQVRHFAHSYLPLAALMQSQIPEIKETVRLFPQSVSVENKEKDLVLQEEKFCYADSNFFDVFSFPLEQGDIRTALKDPNSLVISKTVAEKYFGNTGAIGKELIIEEKNPFRVTGILKDIPANSSIRFEMLAPIASLKKVMGPWINQQGKTWHFPAVYTFAKFQANEGIKTAAARLRDFEKKFLPDYISKERSHEFQELTGIHFSTLETEWQPSISKKVLFIFVAVAIVILLIAAFNFINLFLSRVVYRVRSVGINKVMGAEKKHVWLQTAMESLFYLLVSFLLSVIWVTMFLPVFNSLMGRDLSLISKDNWQVWLILLTVVLVTGLVVSVFPSLLLMRFKLITILKGRSEALFSGKKTFSLQSGFVVFQFVIAVALIIATIVMQCQMSYIRNKNLGFVKEQVVVLPVRDEKMQENFPLIKNKLEQVAGVNKVSAISNFPWEKGYYDFQTTILSNGREMKSNAPTLLVGEDFIESMGMEVVKGRSFSKDFSTDSSMAFIMNETAAAQFGIKDPAGVKLTMQDVSSGEPKQGELIGIVKDFHLQSLHEVIQPLILTISPESYYIDNMVVKLSSKDIPATLFQIQSGLKDISPGRPFEYFFLDNAFDKLYQKESRLSVLFNYFSIMAIIIAGLGLLGIAAFASSRRLKEIGIRKVLGASTGGMVALLSKDFFKLVLVGIAIASPVAWWLMNNWLKEFAYRIQISWWMFLAAGLAAISIALITVSLQAMKAAIANPVKSLRTE